MTANFELFKSSTIFMILVIQCNKLLTPFPPPEQRIPAANLSS